MITTKTCNGCKKVKPLDSDFSRNIRRADGYKSHCKECAKDSYRVRADRKKAGLPPPPRKKCDKKPATTEKQSAAATKKVKAAAKTVISEKQCSKNHCGEVKPVSAFTKRSKAPDGYNNVCKDCRNIYIRDRAARKKAGLPPPPRKAKAERKPPATKTPIVFTTNKDQTKRLVRIANARQMTVEKLVGSFIDYSLKVYRSSGSKLAALAAAELKKADRKAESEPTFYSTAAQRTFVDELSQ